MRAVPVRPALKHWYLSGEPSAAPSPCLLHSFVECATPAAIVHLAVHAFANSQQIASDKLNAAATHKHVKLISRLSGLPSGFSAWLHAKLLFWLGLAWLKLCFAMLCYSMLCHATLCFAMLNHAILTHGLRRHAEVFYVMLYHAVTC